MFNITPFNRLRTEMSGEARAVLAALAEAIATANYRIESTIVVGSAAGVATSLPVRIMVGAGSSAAESCMVLESIRNVIRELALTSSMEYELAVCLCETDAAALSSTAELIASVLSVSEREASSYMEAIISEVLQTRVGYREPCSWIELATNRIRLPAVQAVVSFKEREVILEVVD